LAESSIVQEKALSLSALLRILINEASEHYQTIIRKQDGGRSCLQQRIKGDCFSTASPPGFTGAF